MDIVRAGSRPSRRGPAEWFTGTVLIDPIVEAPAPARVQAVRVTFEPGARTAWHRHPLGQTLFVTAGVALIGRDDGTVERAQPGDTVWFAPGERHWHGAGPSTHMVHTAVSLGETRWEDPVTD